MVSLSMSATASSQSRYQHYALQDLRDAAAKAENVLDEYSIQSSMREDMYQALKGFSDRVDAGEVSISCGGL